MSRYIVDSKKDLLAYEQLIWTPLRCLEDADKAIDDAYQRGVEDGKKSGYEKGLNAVGTYRKGYTICYDDGYEDGKKIIDKGCEGCRYVLKFANDDPCKNCSNCYTSKYEPMPKQDDSIKVGDEVINNTTGTKGILLEPETEDLLATVVVPNNRWNTFNMSHINLTKTGRHFDIQSILDAMKQ